MAIMKASKIWMSGKWVAWDEAKIHILSHVAHYASSVFEGIRCYGTPRGPAIFRLEEHMDRLMVSAKVYRMETAFTRKQIRDACVEAVALNELKEGYIRPLIYRGYENLGVNPFGSPVEGAVAAFPWGKYLGEDALVKGVPVKVSSWQRFAPNTLPALAKAARRFSPGRGGGCPRIGSVVRARGGAGARGPATRAIQDGFFAGVRGGVADRHGWLTLVPEAAGAGSPVGAAPSKTASSPR